MDYTAFENYPLQILGIDESYNSELTAIENFIKTDISYSGVSDDIISLLPYFVFHNFCEKRRSQVTALNGENSHVAEFTIPSYDQQKNVWNIGVEKLDALCLLNTTTAKIDYRLEYSLFGMI